MGRTSTVFFMLITMLPLSVSGQGIADSATVDTIVVKPGPSFLTLPASYYHTKIDFSLSNPSVSQTPNLSGYEVYRISRMQSTMKGAGMGMTAGMMAGAFGQMAGAWDEKSAFAIGGAMAIFGALYGNKRSDDKGWNLQIRLDQDNQPPGGTQLPRK